MKIVLISTYELGRQPFGLASPAAWLRSRGHEVICADLAVAPFPVNAVSEAGLVAFHLPMHTAARLAIPAIERVRQLNQSAHVCCYGLYAPLNENYLRSLGVDTILGGEFEPGLVQAAERPDPGVSRISLDRLQFITPDRGGLPSLSRYAKLVAGGRERRVGYTEASRGCKHRCRHCPVVPVYNGAFRLVQKEVVIEDIRAQVAAGAEHITFGDPDFLNGPGHAVRIVESLAQEFPEVTYDVTAKIEHLLGCRDLLPLFKRTGCLFVTSAVESVEDEVLEKLEKGHTRRDFLAVAGDFRSAGLTLSPTFIPFTPWTSRAGYRDLLHVVRDLDLVENVSPVQLALRLLIPAGSRLLELPEILKIVGPFDQAALAYPWKHGDSGMDELSSGVLRLVALEQERGASRREIFGKIWAAAHEGRPPEDFDLLARAAIPYLNEPWYC